MQWKITWRWRGEKALTYRSAERKGSRIQLKKTVAVLFFSHLATVFFYCIKGPGALLHTPSFNRALAKKPSNYDYFLLVFDGYLPLAVGRCVARSSVLRSQKFSSQTWKKILLAAVFGFKDMMTVLTLCFWPWRLTHSCPEDVDQIITVFGTLVDTSDNSCVYATRPGIESQGQSLSFHFHPHVLHPFPLVFLEEMDGGCVDAQWNDPSWQVLFSIQNKWWVYRQKNSPPLILYEKMGPKGRVTAYFD